MSNEPMLKEQTPAKQYAGVLRRICAATTSAADVIVIKAHVRDVATTAALGGFIAGACLVGVLAVLP